MNQLNEIRIKLEQILFKKCISNVVCKDVEIIFGHQYIKNNNGGFCDANNNYHKRWFPIDI